MKNLFLTYIVIINIISFLTMYIDKVKSINNKWRIRESTLLSLAIIGGSIGSFIAIYTFKHKTKHRKFTFGIPLIVLFQLILIIYLTRL